MSRPQRRCSTPSAGSSWLATGLSWSSPSYSRCPAGVAAASPPGPGLRFVLAKIRRGNPTQENNLPTLFAAQPDVLALLEAQAPLDAPLFEAAPHGMHLSGPRFRWMQRRFAARVPAKEISGPNGPRRSHPALQVFEVARPCAAPVQLWVVHLGSPFSAERWKKMDQLIERWASPPLPGPILVLGDFNSTPDHHDVAALTDALDLEALGPPLPTFLPAALPFRSVLLPILGLRIDHALASPAFAGSRLSHLALAGSDHDALVVDLPDACAD